ncbi:MAG: hypothetical protein VX204_04065 [Candidatus Thermoplasmatota archaeon]|nr:hypothetical protein [Candidatus Thermoplasmatota archaeon]
MVTNIESSLQHPRRSLGNRHRSQARKFLDMSENDSDYIGWAEQSARQAVLHDFTHPDNWRMLVEVKLQASDESGIRAVLVELFSVLGRDSESLKQLDGVDMIDMGSQILEASLDADPLDSEIWWGMTNDSEGGVKSFCERVRTLDLRDIRASVLFSRRLERLRDSGHEDEFLELSKLVLAHRPNNHETWSELGRMHERRGEYDNAWMCYDQAQIHFPNIPARDRFIERMESKMDELGFESWNTPNVDSRVEFLQRMQNLASQSSTSPKADEGNLVTELPLFEVDALLQENRLTEAFFLARGMAAEGIEGALDKVEEIRGML